MLADRIPEIQSALAEAQLDGWLFLCFQQNDPVSLDMLGLSGGTKLVTRRHYYLIPRAGEPRMLVHELEPKMLDGLPGAKRTYLTWQSNRDGLRDKAAVFSREKEKRSEAVFEQMQTERVISDAKTAKLRALRLAKEEADRLAEESDEAE